MKLLTACLLAALAAATSAAPAHASIERLDLAAIVAKSDGSITGTIKDRRVVRIDSEVDGPELYFTILTIEGRSLATDQPLTVEVVHGGGFVDQKHGVWNSEAPAADETVVGARVVAFWKYTPNMGGGMNGNAIYAAHGGLFRTFEARRGPIVQGKGDGYAIDANVTLADLRARVARLETEKRERAEQAARAQGARVHTDAARSDTRPREERR